MIQTYDTGPAGALALMDSMLARVSLTHAEIAERNVYSGSRRPGVRRLPKLVRHSELVAARWAVFAVLRGRTLLSYPELAMLVVRHRGHAVARDACVKFADPVLGAAARDVAIRAGYGDIAERAFGRPGVFSRSGWAIEDESTVNIGAPCERGGAITPQEIAP